MTSQAEIRTLVVSALTGQTDAGANVFDSPSDALQEDALPAITVHTGEEASELLCPYPRTTRRTLPITVKVFVKTQTNDQAAQAAADAIACKVGEILSGERFGSILDDLEFKGNGEKSETAGSVIASAVMEFEATYFAG